MRNASRDLPRVIHTAMPIVIVSYLLANVSYYLVLPGSVIGSSNTVAVAFGTKVFGVTGGLVFALAVSLSCIGALNATTFTSGRLVYVAGKEGYLPAVFGTLGFHGQSGVNPTPIAPQRDYDHDDDDTTFIARVKRMFRRDPSVPHSWSTTPVYAMLLNFALCGVYIVVGEFGTLLTFYGVAGYSFYFLTVLGLIILRVKEPNLERPYRTWIVTPIIFCCVSLFLISRSVFARPLETLAVAAFVGVGAAIWGWRLWNRRRAVRARGNFIGEMGEL